MLRGYSEKSRSRYISQTKATGKGYNKLHSLSFTGKQFKHFIYCASVTAILPKLFFICCGGEIR